MNKKIYVLLILILVAITSTAFFFFRVDIGQQQLTLDNQVDKFSIEFIDKKALINLLKEYKVINRARTKKIRLIISTNKLTDPTFIQTDNNGDTIIASAIDITDRGVAEVEISLGDYIISGNGKNKIGTWLDSEFITIANQLSKWHLATTDGIDYYREIKPFSIFMVEKL